MFVKCRLPLCEVARPQGSVDATFVANADMRRFVGARTRRVRLEQCRVRGVDLSGYDFVSTLEWLDVDE